MVRSPPGSGARGPRQWKVSADTDATTATATATTAKEKHIVLQMIHAGKHMAFVFPFAIFFLVPIISESTDSNLHRCTTRHPSGEARCHTGLLGPGVPASSRVGRPPVGLVARQLGWSPASWVGCPPFLGLVAPHSLGWSPPTPWVVRPPLLVTFSYTPLPPL